MKHMMIRRFCLLLFSMAVIHGSAQVMNIHFKNGGSVNYDTNSIDHIDFTVNGNNPDDPPQETEENVNKNTNGPIEAQTRLEFPHLKNGLVLVHNAELNKNTQQTGVNYCVEWDTDLCSQRWSCYQLYSSINYHSSYNVSRYYASNDGSLSPTCQYPNDPELPIEYQFSVDPYKFSGYDHGHICPFYVANQIIGLSFSII